MTTREILKKNNLFKLITEKLPTVIAFKVCIWWGQINFNIYELVSINEYNFASIISISNTISF